MKCTPIVALLVVAMALLARERGGVAARGARAAGRGMRRIEVPTSVLLRADEVIE